MQETQSGKFTTSTKVNVDFFLPEFSAMKIVTLKSYVYESAEGRYAMILGRDLLTKLELDLKFSKNIIIGGDGIYEGWLAPMVDVGNYDFKYLTDKIVKP